MTKENYYTFEIYKNGELEIVLRSDDVSIYKNGYDLYRELFETGIGMVPIRDPKKQQLEDKK